jgi:hypothetical protein
MSLTATGARPAFSGARPGVLSPRLSDGGVRRVRCACLPNPTALGLQLHERRRPCELCRSTTRIRRSGASRRCGGGVNRRLAERLAAPRRPRYAPERACTAPEVPGSAPPGGPRLSATLRAPSSQRLVRELPLARVGYSDGRAFGCDASRRAVAGGGACSSSSGQDTRRRDARRCGRSQRADP